MFPNQKGIRQQAGFLMPVAIFILVILAGAAITLSRFGSQSGSAVVQEAISSAAFFAAESGGQYAMNRLFYSTVSAPTRAAANASCANINNSTLNFTANGLNNCSAVLTCIATSNLPLNTISFYRMTSTGRCGLSPLNAQRVIELASSLEGVAP